MDRFDAMQAFARVVRLLAHMEEAEPSLSSARASPSGKLRVGVPSPCRHRTNTPHIYRLNIPQFDL